MFNTIKRLNLRSLVDGSTKPLRTQTAVMLLSATTLLAGCGSSSDAPEEPTQSDKGIILNMNIPDSLTGGQSRALATASYRATNHTAAATAQSTGQPCRFIGADEEDPFSNGYLMTKFMVSALASWTCISETIIELASWVPHDGEIQSADNDPQSNTYDPDDPTHYSITDDSENQVTMKLYYGYTSDNPPTTSEQPQFYISWINRANNGAASQHIEGRIVMNSLAINRTERDLDDPAWIRMDFTYTDSQQQADMFLRFDANNPWADGFRIKVTKELNVNPLTQVFLAQGLIRANNQILAVDGIDAIPDIKMFTVSDKMGNGAAIAVFENFGLPLELNPTNNLGSYQFDKEDIYFFDDDQSVGDAWDWINKTITAATYQGGRNTPSTGGTWIPFNPSLDMIAAELNLGDDYFTGAQCVDTGDDCLTLLTAVFEDGFAEQEPNQGEDPQDWRSDTLTNPTYLDTVYPNGVDWTGAFDMVFSP